MKKVFLYSVVLAILFASCNKDKRASKRFMRADVWHVKTLTVDDEIQDAEKVKWLVSECDIYEELCAAVWSLEDKTSQFYWQFNEKAETFTISRVVAAEDCGDFYTEEVEQQTFLFSGVYNVIKSKRNEKVFESTETIGFKGKKVSITLSTLK